jgi:hypothetical protein
MSNRHKKLLIFFAALMCAMLLAVSGPSTATTHAANHQNSFPSPVPLFRTYQPAIVDHFYTTNAAEAQHAVDNLGYNPEGVAARIWPTGGNGLVPLYRMYNPDATDHFYTINVRERDNAINNLGYNDEGIAGFVFPYNQVGLIPLYRLYSPNSTDHFYTINARERDNAIDNLGYNNEGIAAWVLPAW